MTWADAIVFAVGGYCAIGTVVASAFVARGVSKVDAGAAASGWGFRMIIWPGSAALWPLVALRWLQGGETLTKEHP